MSVYGNSILLENYDDTKVVYVNEGKILNKLREIFKKKKTESKFNKPMKKNEEGDKKFKVINVTSKTQLDKLYNNNDYTFEGLSVSDQSLFTIFSKLYERC